MDVYGTPNVHRSSNWLNLVLSNRHSWGSPPCSSPYLEPLDQVPKEPSRLIVLMNIWISQYISRQIDKSVYFQYK